MRTVLMVAEKPSLAQSIAKILSKAVPGDGTYTRDGDELKVQGVAGRGEAAGVLLEHRHPQGHGDGLQAEGRVQAPAGVAGVAAGLVDDLRHPVQVDVLPGERRRAGRQGFSPGGAVVQVQVLPWSRYSHVGPGGDAALVDAAGQVDQLAVVVLQAVGAEGLVHALVSQWHGHAALHGQQAQHQQPQQLHTEETMQRCICQSLFLCL
ncbi:hypothetical protein EYF80_046600 [Liparis tanakae]|uniref:Uncharacterized protein n=1 Tax=Liparis tanakae TaxID=230148 RepID=A0A4Z2FPX2_9TELE|nr:hypothetical protein EYF80_046600 [Liparis tanakae]